MQQSGFHPTVSQQPPQVAQQTAPPPDVSGAAAGGAIAGDAGKGRVKRKYAAEREKATNTNSASRPRDDRGDREPLIRVPSEMTLRIQRVRKQIH